MDKPVLILDDARERARELQAVLEFMEEGVEIASHPRAQWREALTGRSAYAVAFVGLGTDAAAAAALLHELRTLLPGVPLVLVADEAGIPAGCAGPGVFAVVRPFRHAALATLQTQLAEYRQAQASGQIGTLNRRPAELFRALVGSSPAIVAVRKLIERSGTKTRQVVMAMPQSAVITKRIMLPAGLREEEMELQVESEANQYIPFSLDEVSLDFCVIGPSTTSAGDVEVLIAASRKDRVQDRQGLAEAAGLKPVVLDIESHASRLAMGRVVSALPNEGRDALVALFEIGADTTSLKVLRDDEMLYDRDQAFGGSQLTQLISRQYGFSFEEAEAKKLANDLPDDYESAILAPFVDSLSQEIGRALQYFFTSTPHHKVHYVMLAGGTATLPGLKDRVTELTGFASQVVNPFDRMKLGSAVRESSLRREAPSYLTACGLAMRRFVQ